MTPTEPIATTKPTNRYSPSWVDQLTVAIERLPGPDWVAYVVVLVILALIANAAAWIDGRLPIGTPDPYLLSLPFYPVGALAAIRYLDTEAAAALDEMRPALDVEESEYVSLRYELTTLPAGATIVWTIIGLAVAFAYVLSGLAMPVRNTGPLVTYVDIAFAVLGFPLLAVLLFHTVRQLRLISRIQNRLSRIDLFQIEPLHAFSGVTARSGLAILGIAYVSAATDPSTFTFANPPVSVFVAIAVATAVGAFVVPLLGIHRRIVSEKRRLLSAANHDLETVLSEISLRARAKELSDADALNKQLSSVVLQRDVIARIPTWPWEPGTLRGFVTAVVLPIALWLAFRALERLIG